MKQIRIGWSVTCRRDAKGSIVFGGDWEADLPQARTQLHLISKVANKHHGDGSHWLEERVSPVMRH